MNPSEGNYPESFALLQNYPNPFNSSTMISFILHAPSSATLRIFDETGRLVRTLLEEQPYEAGQHRIHWDGYDDRRNPVSSGIYICQLNAGRTRRSIKLVLMN
jgi:flagellar hook assembly protein FlgD